MKNTQSSLQGKTGITCYLASHSQNGEDESRIISILHWVLNKIITSLLHLENQLFETDKR